MTPKEKAEELVDKFIEFTKEWDELDGYVENKFNAEKCALIAIDEVIEALHEHHWQNRLIINYWEEIKREIEKL
jgi:hypothetical protein